MIAPTRDTPPSGMPERPAPIAVTIGDPAGIGPDITLMDLRLAGGTSGVDAGTTAGCSP